MKRYLLGLDAGTTAFKAALFDEHRNFIAVHQKDYTLLTPAQNFVEFPAESYWLIFCELIRELLSKTEISVCDIVALAISSQGETLICLDKENQPIGNAIVWLDNRATAQADALRSKFGIQEVYEQSGQADMLATWPAAKILWLKENRPEQYAETKTYLLLEDYLLLRLTGKLVGEPNLWASSTILNMHTACWWPEMLGTLGITAGQLPELLPCGTKVGTLTAEARQATGLSARTIVVTGALDQTCNTIGCGLTLPGMICETTGSCLAVSAVLDHFVHYDEKLPITCQNHAVPGRYTVLLWSQSAGMTLKWFAKQFYPDFKELDAAFDQINAEAAKVPMGCSGLTMLPHLTGAANPEYDAAARGVFSGVTLEHGRGHFARAVMEAVACMLRRNLEQIASMGIRFDEVFCMGGGAKSPLWLQIKADITGKAMRPLRSLESACLGAAILAGVGAEIYDSIDWKSDNLERSDRLAPDFQQKDECDALYLRYIRLYDALKGYFAENALQMRKEALEDTC